MHSMRLEWDSDVEKRFGNLPFMPLVSEWIDFQSATAVTQIILKR